MEGKKEVKKIKKKERKKEAFISSIISKNKVKRGKGPEDSLCARCPQRLFLAWSQTQ